MSDIQVGVISCSGEECLGGTLSRLATRKVMETLRKGKVVSLCLPLYIAGGDEEREFAKEYPVIAVDGCDKCCAKRATLKYSGEVKDALVLSELLGEDIALSKVVSARDLKEEHYHMANNIAKEICKKVDEVLAE
ncbi:putative zinc-binding protein [Sinanaerobacter chloroacetimidivorans]|uniref:Putative zinc-binding protein n=1 Tax=Sinanaerobacter chloroacetimidivorans TaxID=2818044 RepID=A0A8J7W179_9FIRM|nr:putative zinc-binding protein [Sinanaerobacter chloroacetimidivorans]MBR0598551.1 putative zinc-binding protein [Sinanaerobacter chloroacetimidivorans]